MQRTTVLLDPQLHRAIKLRAATPGAPSISEQINEALRRALAEDQSDAASIRRTVRETRAQEWVSYEDAVQSLKDSGRL
ncbi:MAG TPA: CopG family transcriptional regulator [Thermoanaerobaculia bacterium]|nr:CopG family transcriptional regulator [Thermoanaerobaculia bacterium]